MSFLYNSENGEKMKKVVKGCAVVIKYLLCTDVACPAGNHTEKVP